MKKFLPPLVAAAAAFLLSSCLYDPYGTGPAVSAGIGVQSGGPAYSSSYNAGYGYGYGYGAPTFSTSLFIGTGSPLWGYDPYCRCYYNHQRHCYYDPYLYGYYPVGYRPPVLHGVPHPHGYRNGYCPAPANVRNVQVVRYNNRLDAYKGSNFGWARQVRQEPVGQGNTWGKHPVREVQQQQPRQAASSPAFFGSRYYGSQERSYRESPARQELNRRQYAPRSMNANPRAYEAPMNKGNSGWAQQSRPGNPEAWRAAKQNGKVAKQNARAVKKGWKENKKGY